MCCGNKFCCSENKTCFCLESKTFLLPEHKFCVQNMFLSLATPGNITRNIVSVPGPNVSSLARPVGSLRKDDSNGNNNATNQ